VLILGSSLMLGPQVGSVFSAVTKGLGGGNYNTTIANTQPNPSTPVPNSNMQPAKLPEDRLIIRTGNISITVNKVADTLDQLAVLAKGKGGLVFSNNVTQANGYTNATMTLQIPPDQFEETLSAIRKLAITVTNENSTSQDVTEEYVDNDAQIKNLTQTEQQLNTLLTKANTVGEVLSVQHEITTVRGQIDQLQGRQNYLAKRSSMSSITINIATVATTPAEVEPNKNAGWDVGKIIQNSWQTSLKVLQKLAEVLIILVMFVWAVPLLLVALLLVAWSLLVKAYPQIKRNLSPR
jgi:hypothetical protein